MKSNFISKIIFFAITIVLLNFSTQAQNVNTIGVELGGNGGLYSVNFHKDFIRSSKTSFFAARVGVSALPFVEAVRANLVLETTYTMFQHFELGIGVSPFNVPVKKIENAYYENENVVSFPVLGRIGYRTNMGEKYLLKVAFLPVMYKNLRTDTNRFAPWFGVFIGRKL